MPPQVLSRLDLHDITEAIRVLYRIIEKPPAEGWQPPNWLIEQYQKTTLSSKGEARLKEHLGNLNHAGLINAAATEVLNRIMPPWHHTKPDCPEITESSLDLPQQALLIGLRNWLSTSALGQSLTSNRSELVQALVFIESVLKQLEGPGQEQEANGLDPAVVEAGCSQDEPSPQPPEGHRQSWWLWPLVGERTWRRDPLPELARDENRERQSRYCQGFDPDCWIPALVAAEWRSRWYPREETRESVHQWQMMIDQMCVEYLGPWAMPERAAELQTARENDLALIRQYAPRLLETKPAGSRPGTDAGSPTSAPVPATGCAAEAFGVAVALTEAPLPCPRSVLVGHYADYFRRAANRFRSLPPYTDIKSPGDLAQSQLVDECGTRLIEAWKRGLTSSIPKLDELATWHTTERPRAHGHSLVSGRGPGILFRHLCGGHLTSFEGGRLPRVRVEGGLLPRLIPGLLELPQRERFAAACEMVAGFIEEAPESAGAEAAQPGGCRVVPPDCDPNRLAEPTAPAVGAVEAGRITVANREGAPEQIDSGVASSGPANDPAPPPRKPKRSTERGEARVKIIAALIKHHQYANDSCLHLEPIGNNELARQIEVSESSVSRFFEKEFKGHSKYQAICTNASQLVIALKMLNGEYSPHILYGAKPPAETEPDDE
jgi:hypothetical protein